MIKINPNIARLKPSATLAINQNVAQLRNGGQEVFHFGFGQSPFPIHKSIVEVLKSNAEKSSYLPTAGLEVLRKQIVQFLKMHQGINAEWEYVFIGPGSKELLYQTILILEGTFLIPKGSWVSYLPQIHSKNGNYEILDTELKNDFKLRAEVLEKYCKEYKEEQKILILNSPNNPTGAVYSSSELQKLAEVCKEYELIVMSDEIYSQINFHESFSPSMSTFYPERTIVFGGLSKVFSAGGYRLGFMYLPRELQHLKKVYSSLFSETFSAVASPIQYAAIEAFKMEHDVKKYIEDCSLILNNVSAYLYNNLKSFGLACTRSDGAFYMMVGFNQFKTQINSLNISTSTELAKYLLLNYKVALLPGSDFYFLEDDLFFRLAFVDFDGLKVINAYKQQNLIDEEFIKLYCPNIYKGVKQIQEFIHFLKKS